jgi:hypothetical protein
MQRTRRMYGLRVLTSSKRVLNREGVATVASSGVRVRLVRVDADREREVSDLIASYERLCVEWRCLFERAAELLGEDFRGGPFNFPSRAYTVRD